MCLLFSGDHCRKLYNFRLLTGSIWMPILQMPQFVTLWSANSSLSAAEASCILSTQIAQLWLWFDGMQVWLDYAVLWLMRRTKSLPTGRCIKNSRFCSWTYCHIDNCEVKIWLQCCNLCSIHNIGRSGFCMLPLVSLRTRIVCPLEYWSSGEAISSQRDCSGLSFRGVPIWRRMRFV